MNLRSERQAEQPVMMIIKRRDAVKMGLDLYFTGKPCHHGHLCERSVNGGCVKCREIYNAELRSKSTRTEIRHPPLKYLKFSQVLLMVWPGSRMAAKQSGLRYYDGRVCDRCCGTIRRTSDRKCLLCAREEYKSRNRTAYFETSRLQRIAAKTEIACAECSKPVPREMHGCAKTCSESCRDARNRRRISENNHAKHVRAMEQRVSNCQVCGKTYTGIGYGKCCTVGCRTIHKISMKAKRLSFERVRNRERARRAQCAVKALEEYGIKF